MLAGLLIGMALIFSCCAGATASDDTAPTRLTVWWTVAMVLALVGAGLAA